MDYELYSTDLTPNVRLSRINYADNDFRRQEKPLMRSNMFLEVFQTEWKKYCEGMQKLIDNKRLYFKNS